MLDLPVS